MTKHDVLAAVRQTQPGEYTDEWVLDQISTCEQRLLKELLDGYTVPEVGGELVAPAPYDQIYYWWVMANIALSHKDTAGYNNFTTMYNALYDEYGRAVSRQYNRDIKYYYKLD